MAAATNRQARERRRDPSGGLLTKAEFGEVYDQHGDELWRKAMEEEGSDNSEEENSSIESVRLWLMP